MKRTWTHNEPCMKFGDVAPVQVHGLSTINVVASSEAYRNYDAHGMQCQLIGMMDGAIPCPGVSSVRLGHLPAARLRF